MAIIDFIFIGACSALILATLANVMQNPVSTAPFTAMDLENLLIQHNLRLLLYLLAAILATYLLVLYSTLWVISRFTRAVMHGYAECIEDQCCSRAACAKRLLEERHTRDMAKIEKLATLEEAKWKREKDEARTWRDEEWAWEEHRKDMKEKRKMAPWEKSGDEEQGEGYINGDGNKEKGKEEACGEDNAGEKQGESIPVLD